MAIRLIESLKKVKRYFTSNEKDIIRELDYTIEDLKHQNKALTLKCYRLEMSLIVQEKEIETKDRLIKELRDELDKFNLAISEVRYKMGNLFSDTYPILRKANKSLEDSFGSEPFDDWTVFSECRTKGHTGITGGTGSKGEEPEEEIIDLVDEVTDEDEDRIACEMMAEMIEEEFRLEKKNEERDRKKVQS